MCDWSSDVCSSDLDGVTHYDTLGVDPSASPAEIRAAYKRCAMRLHPDRNKSETAEEEFKRVQHAYDVLGDPERRARYDATGQDGKGDRRGEAEQALANLFMALIEQTIQPEYVDMTALMRKNIDAHQTNYRAQQADAENHARKLRSHVHRIQRKTGKLNLLARAMEQKAATLERAAAECAEHVALGEQMKSILEEYSYTVDAREEPELPRGYVRFGSTGSTTWTST
jgi:curved DNA-binding protein CbpA